MKKLKFVIIAVICGIVSCVIYWYFTPVTHKIDFSNVTNVWLPFEEGYGLGWDYPLESMFEYPTVKLDKDIVLKIIKNARHKRIILGNQPFTFNNPRWHIVFEDTDNNKHLALFYCHGPYLVWFPDSDKYYQVSDSDRSMWDQYVITLSESRFIYFESWPVRDRHRKLIGYEAIRINRKDEVIPFEKDEEGVIDHWEPEKDSSGKIVRWHPVWK